MSLLEAIVLGIVQGLTEFLPVSSSGHIELAQALLGMESLAENEDTLSVALHGATALSTLVVFRRDVWDILRGLLHFRWNEETRFAAKIVLSMIPAVFVGLFFEEQLEMLFDNQILLVGCMLLLTGGLLWFADRAGHPQMNVNFPRALGIGLAQMVAILPGISRSGATISTALLLRVDRDRAARFSFLMVVPLILGKMTLDLKDGAETGFAAWQGMELALAAGFLAAFISGMLACRWMLLLVRNSQLTYFAIYCIIVGVLAIGWSIFG